MAFFFFFDGMGRGGVFFFFSRTGTGRLFLVVAIFWWDGAKSLHRPAKGGLNRPASRPCKALKFFDKISVPTFCRRRFDFVTLPMGKKSCVMFGHGFDKLV